MKDVINQIEYFLFDIIGIIVPGFVISAFIYYISIDSINRYIDERLLTICKDHFTTVFIIVIVLLYIIGTVVKVLAIIQYKLCSKLFNPISELFKYMNSKLRGSCECKLEEWIQELIRSFVDILVNVFTFEAQSYSLDFENMKDTCIKKIKSKIEITGDIKWYSLYKLCTIIIREESLSSLSEKFLAKYNFYRSMAFVLLCMATYLMCGSIRIPHQSLIIAILWISWYSFHIKFKRYWTLCGDDTMLSVLYFMNKEREI